MNLIRLMPAVLSLLLLSTMQIACANNNYTFDKDNLNQARYADNKNIKYVLWNDSTKTAKIITTQDELISVKHWSCDHPGVHAVMLIGPNSEDNFSDINKFFKKLASISLDEHEASQVNNYLSKHVTALDQGTQTFRLESPEYSEFYLMLSVVNESIVIEIKYYRN